jgi:hypothetical protein
MCFWKNSRHSEFRNYLPIAGTDVRRHAWKWPGAVGAIAVADFQRWLKTTSSGETEPPEPCEGLTF